MLLKISVLRELAPTVKELANTSVFKGKTALDFRRGWRKVEADLDDFEKHRTALIQRLGQPEKDGSYIVKAENVEEFRADYDEAAAQEIELSLPKVTDDDVIRAELNVIQVDTLERIGCLSVEGGEDGPK